MQVVILAAGRGDRFVKAGYTVPKPLILARGKSMVQYAMAQVRAVNDRPVVLCPDALRYDIWRAAPVGILPTVIGVSHVQSGAAMTLLAAASALNEREPVLVVDCDSVIAPAAMERFVACAKARFMQDVDATVMCFQPTDNSARYSFVETTEDNAVVRIAEKDRISDLATCGAHIFTSWYVLRDAICKMVAEEDITNGEYYLAPVHNYVLASTAFTVAAGEFTAIGTPEQLEAYEQGQ
jgi:NDP-sugar pyrophosphorylase family protein